MHKKFSENPRLVVYGWFVCSLAALFYCYEYLLRIEPSVMVPELMRYFDIGAGTLGFAVSLYYWAYTPLQAFVGILTDYFGPKKILTLAIGLCSIGAFIFGIAHNVYLAGLGRFLIGAGSAFAFVGVLKLASIWLPRNCFALFAGIATSLGMLGAMLGDIEMSWLVHRLSWQWVIFISAGVGIILIPIFLFFVHERKKVHGEKYLTSSFKNSIKGFVQCIKNTQLIYAGLIGCALYLSLAVFAELWGIPFVHTLKNHSGVYDATINSMVFLGWLVGGPLNGVISDLVKSRRLPLIVGSLLAATCIAIILLFPHMNVVSLAILLFFFGFFASAEILVFAVGKERMGIKFTGTAMSVINLIIMLSGMIVQPLVAWLLTLNWQGVVRHGVHIYSLTAYREALSVIPVAMLIAAFLAYCMKESYHLSLKKEKA